MSVAKLFKSGDVVQLKSGGPEMTVKFNKNLPFATDETQEVICQWFKDDELKIESFYQTTLEKVEDND